MSEVGGGQATAAPGWYPDPDGAPGLVRWWNGFSWSDVTTPAGPGVAVGAAFQSPPHPTVPPSQPWASTAPARRSRRTPLLVGAGVLALVVVLLLVGVFTGGSGRDDAGAPTAVPTIPAGPTFAPGTVRIVDPDAGISYPFLGDGWYEYGQGAPVETASVAGQYFVTQETLPDSLGEFIAQCTSGPVVDGYGWSGAASLESTVQTIADSVRANYYPGPNERTVRRSAALTVDGAAAWVYEFDLSWDVEGYDASGERAALLLIDVGRPAPALLYLSIPNTHAELYGVIDRVLGDVDVL
ncbi:Protein of unknown function [Modestobacter sp. DSM 44400]|uniref:DUF2510 domain-containing protein n=1 Tax=Modestobacter sp. DSM 44400 TaxID=1550230 RepID=UPI000895DFCC|nr:DUF2510 domain-containing protein [Modestobacter sp. DSM 44400]SDX48041.1 Protein of unknown function [Modestobacter sp. DSM 44400]